MDVCERCGFPAIEVAGNWVHESMADAAFCAIVMVAIDLGDVTDGHLL